MKAWPTLTGGVPVSGGDYLRRKASQAYHGPVVDLDWNKQRCRTDAASRLAFAYHGTASAPWRFLPSLVMCLVKAPDTGGNE